MELGFQDKRKAVVLIALLVLLAFAVVYAINNAPGVSSDAASVKATEPPAGTKTTSASARLTPAQRRRQQALDFSKLDPTIHIEKLKASAAEYATTQRNLFRYESPPPPPPPKKTPQQIAEEKRARENQPPPPPPPIDLRYYGYVTEAGSAVKKVFLTNGQDIFIATEGEIIANRYKIVRIGVNSVEVEDLQSKNRQQLPLIEG